MNTPNNQLPINPHLDAFHPHAKFFEFAFRMNEIAKAFIRYALRDTIILPGLQLDKLKVQPGKFLDADTFKGSEADMVYTIPYQSDGEEQEIVVYTLLEHKSTNDYNAIRQLGRYSMHLTFIGVPESPDPKESWESEIIERQVRKESDRLPLVIPILIHHGKDAYSGPTQLREYYPKIHGFERFTFNFEPIIIDLTATKMEDLPNDVNEMPFNIVITIMKLVFQEDRFEDVERCFLELFPFVSSNQQYMELAKTAILYFWIASHTDHNRFLHLLKTSYPQEQEGGENTVLSLLEQSRLDGVQEGIEKGIEKGELKATRSVLVNVLQARFKNVPDSIKTRIESIADVVVLNSLVVEASQCQTIEEFQKSL